MKETMYEITYLQTQLLVLDMLRAKVSAKLNKVYEGTDMEAVKEIIANDKLMKDEYSFGEDDQRKAIKDIIGKDLNFDEIRNELIGDIDE